jgi:pimeloyl-ACP methyl ester carboxylesterase
MRSTARIIAGSLAAGITAAAALVTGPFAGAEEHVITGVTLLALAAGWALIAIHSMRCSDQPQRWAFLLAGYLGVAGGGLLVCAPDDTMFVALGWFWPATFLVVIGFALAGARTSLHSRAERWLVYPMLAAYALSALGGAFQTYRESVDRPLTVIAGSLVNVGGRRVYLACRGSGSPAVLLEPGLGETSASWGLIAPALAQTTTVCIYDRAGRGGSGAASVPQDGVAVADDLRELILAAGVAGPFVLVGHSSGALYVRIFAARYPEQVAGMVLLDAQPAEALTRLPSYPSFYRNFRRVSALLPSLARIGVGRLIFHNAFGAMPAVDRDRQRASYSSARHYRSLRSEFAELPRALAQASAVREVRDWPLLIITAGREAQPGWLALQDELATLSSNSVHRVLADATHASLVEDPGDAAASSRAIRDVVESVRGGRRHPPLQFLQPPSRPSTQLSPSLSNSAYFR